MNTLSEEEAEAGLLACCGSKAWAAEMARRRPFQSTEGLLETADQIFRRLSRDDWLEAFRGHPRIGESASGWGTKDRWSRQEQAGAHSSAHDTMAALGEANRAYEDRFGFIFIVCATGKTGDEMLSLLRERLRNDPETELGIAAEEQRKITHLRLRKLLES